ncbi:MAG: hypothetical protein HUU01_11715 [Saprospiraceae bacterium]|nr:hypothetical protein [Saprospiraceae bacterium]
MIRLIRDPGLVKYFQTGKINIQLLFIGIVGAKGFDVVENSQGCFMIAIVMCQKFPKFSKLFGRQSAQVRDKFAVSHIFHIFYILICGEINRNLKQEFQTSPQSLYNFRSTI